MSGPPGRAVRVAAACGWVEQDGTVYVAALPDGPPLVLEGSGALVWEALLVGGTVAEVVARVADEAGESAATVAPGVGRFVDDLVAAGVVEVLDPPAAPAPSPAEDEEQ